MPRKRPYRFAPRRAAQGRNAAREGLDWFLVGASTLQMMALAPFVIATRMSRVNTPAQLFTMGSEKVVAASQSATAMALAWSRMSVTSAPDWPAFWRGALRPYHRRVLANARRR